MRRLAAIQLLVLAVAAPLAAQSSQFGVRGLGLPGRGLSVSALGGAGSGALFDGRSSRNPAAPGLMTGTALVFTSTQAWRTSENPGGSGSTNEHRFPHLLIGGPLPGVPLALTLSYSSYAVRDYTIVRQGFDSPREVDVPVTDSLGSTGGINDMRLALAWSPSDRIIVGTGLHLLTGSNRIFSVRAWEDTAYLPVRQTAELAYSGVGISAGVVLQPARDLHIAGTLRYDGSLNVQRDSADVGTIDLPWTLSAAARYRPADLIAVSVGLSTQNWSVANTGVIDFGGVAARNTVEVAAGVELIRNIRRPEHLPVRLGVRHAELPFLLVEGSQPRELTISAGTGFRFARDLGGIDLALERVSRSQGSEYKESAWQLSVGVSLRGILPTR
jgi:hypothetical protein